MNELVLKFGYRYWVNYEVPLFKETKFLYVQLHNGGYPMIWSAHFVINNE